MDALALDSLPVIQSRIGEVAKVVTSAMITSIANRVGEMHAEVEADVEHDQLHEAARVHQDPRAAESRHGRPERRAAIVLPPNLPTHATRMISPHSSHCSAPLTSWICVRSPLNAKNAGRRSTTTRSSRRSLRARARRLSCGMHDAEEERAEERVDADPFGRQRRRQEQRRTRTPSRSPDVDPGRASMRRADADQHRPEQQEA